MPIDLKKCCGTHSKEKEDNGECCQTKENAEPPTHEPYVSVEAALKEQNE